ncbi:hypothetical protein KBD61_01230 [Patescibacteria group bacterium]|nr:hypothetical protein [Patescibacteria group bacterium]
MFSSEAQRLVGSLSRIGDVPRVNITDSVVLRIARTLLLDPRFNDAYAPVLGYAAEAAINRLYEDMANAKDSIEEAEKRIKRAKEAGYDTKSLEERLVVMLSQGSNRDTTLALKK